MDFVALFQFLEELQENNHKEWMDAHRKQYQSVRNDFMHWLDTIDQKLAQIDPNYYPTPGKKGINRINNNLLFHPHKPVYKDHFGAGLDQLTKQGDFYIQIGITESLFAGGYWRPDSKTLKSIREAIDYNGDVLMKIIHDKNFKKTFGSLYDDGNALQKAPKGYAIDHPHISLLQRKTFAVIHQVTKQEVLSPDFKEKVIQVYQDMLPFRNYLREAVTV